MRRKNFGWLALGLVLQLLFVSLAEAAAGRFQFVVGEVKVLDAAGKERPARKGGEVNEGESIFSGASGTAQILLADGGILAVRPDTRMKIDEYKFDGKDDGSERSFFSIVKGGFRSITGLIGKKHKENYGIKTPSATIGIRGTDSETVHVVTPLPGVPEGTYNKVNTGATVMNGTVINPNQVGYTPNLQTPAVILPAMPPIFEAAKPGQGQKKEEKDNGEKKAQQGDKKDQQQNGEDGSKKNASSSSQDSQQDSGQAASDNGSTSSTSSTSSPITTTAASTVTAPPPATTTIVTGGTVTSGGVAPAASYVDAPYGYGGVGSEISWRTECVGSPTCTSYTGYWAGAGAIVREAGKTQTMLVNSATGMPILLAEQDTYDNFQYSAGTAAVYGYGSTTLPTGEKVAWGRYVGADSMVDKDGIARDPLVMNLAWASSVLTYLEANNYVNSLAANKSFSTLVGGSVTDELGNVYSTLSGALTINYPTKDISLSISASTSGRSWSLSYGNSGEGIQQFYGGGCTTGPCGLGLLSSSTYDAGSTINILAAGGKGEAHGVLIGSGSTVNGALTSFSATVPGTAAISGAIVLK
ncbi:MAG: FecR domain-containing protein [Sulfuricellaceae bacterium]